jgi:hypothetical protein
VQQPFPGGTARTWRIVRVARNDAICPSEMLSDTSRPSRQPPRRTRPSCRRGCWGQRRMANGQPSAAASDRVDIATRWRAGTRCASTTPLTSRAWPLVSRQVGVVLSLSLMCWCAVISA